MITRPLALFLGLFSMLNVVGGILRQGFDVNLWWIDLRPLPHVMMDVLLAVSGLALVAWAVVPTMGRRRRIATVALVTMMLAAAAVNTVQFYVLLAYGLKAGFPVPMSLLVFLAMAGLMLAVTRRLRKIDRDIFVMRRPPARPWRRRAVWAGVFGGCLVAMPLLQMFCFGKTDYRRGADAIVVFGAGVYADGKPSDALMDRVRTGCELYHQGLAPKIVLSGGPGQGEVHETAAMRELAIKFGVPAEAIIIDQGGVNTQSTVKNTAGLAREAGWKSILMVSHFYHLPRAKMCAGRQGLDVFTVPAKESYLLSYMPYYMAREVAALWAYYMYPLM